MNTYPFIQYLSDIYPVKSMTVTRYLSIYPKYNKYRGYMCYVRSICVHVKTHTHMFMTRVEKLDKLIKNSLHNGLLFIQLDKWINISTNTIRKGRI